MVETDPQAGTTGGAATAAGSAPDHADVVALPPVVYLGALALGVVAKLVLGGSLVPGSALRAAVGAVLAVGGIALLVPFMRAFRRAGQDPNPRTPTPSLVTAGIFAWTRNPAYLGMTILYVGLALLLDNPWMLAFLVPVLVLMQFGVILREEAYLERKFGDEYRAYKEHVRRWI
jgi:protein-S-isoprenylcysteine O-methyltransferase Ste14